MNEKSSKLLYNLYIIRAFKYIKLSLYIFFNEDTLHK